MDVTIVSQSYSATKWQQEVCHFQHAFDKSGRVSFNYSKKKIVCILYSSVTDPLSTPQPASTQHTWSRSHSPEFWLTAPATHHFTCHAHSGYKPQSHHSSLSGLVFRRLWLPSVIPKCLCDPASILKFRLSITLSVCSLSVSVISDYLDNLKIKTRSVCLHQRSFLNPSSLPWVTISVSCILKTLSSTLYCLSLTFCASLRSGAAYSV